MRNTLYYGDNLPVLRSYIKDESIDLVYLDPPFNSSRSYNVLFANESGQESESQITAFADTWHWNQTAENTLYDLISGPNDAVSTMIGAMREFIGPSQMMAYLVMMTTRLMELHRVLKPTGSLYLHCDPTASHYLKVILDTVFGPEKFGNHIIWQRSDTHNDATKQFPSVSDHLLFYAKGKDCTFNKQHTTYPEKTLKNWCLHLDLPDGTVRRMTKIERETQQIPPGARRFNVADMTSPNPRPNLMYTYKGYPYPPKGWRYSLETMTELDNKGLLLFPSNQDGRIMRKRYLDEQQGPVIGDVWADISQLRGSDAERLGYPTQKPEALLERIIAASSNPGDVVLDPFCGCGTTVAAAEKLGRKWIGIDVTHLAVALQKSRLKEQFPDIDFEVIGEPQELGAAHQLASEDRFQFQWWALGLVKARPYGSTDGRTGKKGKDRGVDGVINFVDAGDSKPQRVIVQVKSGKVNSRDIRELRGTLDREKAAIGLFITLEDSTSEMTTEAVTAGFYESRGWGRAYPRLQILTINELLAGKRPDMPQEWGTMKQAQRTERKSDVEQKSLFD